MMTIPVDHPLRPGDVILVDLRPVLGTEQDGLRPALVVSVVEMHEITRRAIICPITLNRDPWPTKIVLPAGLCVEGAILTDQARSIDRQARILRWIGTVPSSVLNDVTEQLALLLGLSPA